ncbi:MAG: four helix bundle protein [Candidatus Brocadiia bacterium]
MEERKKGYRNLLAWQKADELAFQIYKGTELFPKSELYALTSQLRRAALSVPTNIVEGFGRKGKGEMKYFTNIALGSLAEVEYLLGFSERLGYLSKDAYNKFEGIRNETGRLLWGYYESL